MPIVSMSLSAYNRAMTTIKPYNDPLLPQPNVIYDYGVRPPSAYIQTEQEELPPRITLICDIDGVLANISHRLHYIEGKQKDYDKFYSEVEMLQDSPLVHGIELVRALLGVPRGYITSNHDTQIYFVTGRPEQTRGTTVTFLVTHLQEATGLSVGEFSKRLYMRRKGDYRPSPEIKSQLIHNLLDENDIVFDHLVYYLDDDPMNCLRIGLDYPSMIPITFSIIRM